MQWSNNARKTGLLTLLIALVVLSAVVAIAVLPGLNLQPTALRAARAAQGVLVGFSLLASVANGFSEVAAPSLGFLYLAGGLSRFPHPPLCELTCARLC